MSAICASRILLSISAADLLHVDVFSKVDPFAVVTDKRLKREIGKTDILKNTLSPSFPKMVVIDYFFEVKQTVEVALFGFQSSGRHTPLGFVEFTLGQLMSSRNATLTLSLQTQGSVTLVALPQGQTKGTLTLQFQGRDFPQLNCCSGSDLFYQLDRILPNGRKQKLCRSEVQRSVDPLWAKMTPPLDLQAVCSGNTSAKSLHFSLFHDGLLGESLLGEFSASVDDIVAARASFCIDNPNETNKPYGSISLAVADLKVRPDFLQLIRAGLQINIAFSIDFTASNVEVKNPKSLHHYHPKNPNQYIQAMIAISDVVQEYDSDRKFPCFGFGAILPGEVGGNNFFHLNFQPNPYVCGMQAVIDTYVAASQIIRLYGPTNFAPTIRNVTHGARDARGMYTILLIMTDGEITDMNETIDALVEADDAPISILVVGIGLADFHSMQLLDSDQGMLKHSSGRVSRRDIVQFVPMRDFLQRGATELASELLAEIPDQVSTWAMLCPEAVAHLGRAAAATARSGEV